MNALNLAAAYKNDALAFPSSDSLACSLAKSMSALTLPQKSSFSSLSIFTYFPCTHNSDLNDPRLVSLKVFMMVHFDTVNFIFAPSGRSLIFSPISPDNPTCSD